MSNYETTATVEERGQIHLSGVPFAAGTEVAVVIQCTRNGADGSGRTARLLAALDAARNTESVGRLNRAAIYDRNVLH